MRSYELMFVLDPRLSDDEASSLTDDFRNLAQAGGAQVLKVEHWGRRKLAYEIEKLKEGRYVLFYLLSENSKGFAEIERRMQQSDKVLRYLTVRTDEELRRAGLPLPTAEQEAAPSAAAAKEEVAQKAEAAEAPPAETDGGEEE